MNFSDFVKRELCGWGRFEGPVFILLLVSIFVTSIYMNDSKIALISAISGVSYTTLAGKGKISCYFFGLCGTLCYAFLSFKNMLFGNLVLYICYYFPMQIFGIFKWKEHLKPNSSEIYKTKLTKKEMIAYLLISIIATVIVYFVLVFFNDSNPLIDTLTSVLSVFGLILTVKRCIEQWYLWFVVNILSFIMWINAYMNGSNCFATILMWAVYSILSIYFLYTWRKEISEFENL